MTQEAKILSAIGAVTVIILAAAVFFITKASPTSTTATSSATADPKLLIRSDSHSTASSSAKLKVNVVEFGDYQCPACEAAYPITKQILSDYANKINFVFRNFPLPQHQYAQLAAEAAEAAGDQGKFWQMHDKLYDTQNDWVNSNNPMNFFLGYAKSLGLDQTKFQNDVTQNKFSNKIQQDINDGNALGVDATPTFYVNGEKLEGVPTYDDLKTTIDSFLK